MHKEFLVSISVNGIEIDDKPVSGVSVAINCGDVERFGVCRQSYPAETFFLQQAP